MKNLLLVSLIVLILASSCGKKPEVVQNELLPVYDFIEVYHWKRSPWGNPKFTGLRTDYQLKYHKSLMEKYTIKNVDSLDFISMRINEAQMDSIFNSDYDANMPIIALLHRNDMTDTLSISKSPCSLNKFNNFGFKDGLLSQYFIESVSAKSPLWASDLRDAKLLNSRMLPHKNMSKVELYDSVKICYNREIAWNSENKSPDITTDVILEDRNASHYNHFIIKECDSLKYISSRVRQARLDSIVDTNYNKHNDIIALLYKGNHTDTLAMLALPTELSQLNNKVFKDGLLSLYLTESIMQRDSLWKNQCEDYALKLHKMSYNNLQFRQECFNVKSIKLNTGMCLSYCNLVDCQNLYDQYGRKYGLWFTQKSTLVKCCYYEDGIKNGFFWHEENYNLRRFGEYRYGIPSYFYSFDAIGHLQAKYDDFKVNTIEVDLMGDGSLYKYPFSCQCTLYSPNGQVRCRGTVLYDEDPEMSTSWKYGEWK